MVRELHSSLLQGDFENYDTKSTIAKLVEQKTGIPAKDLTVMMGGYNQITVLDRKSNVLIGSCGISMGAGTSVCSEAFRKDSRALERARSVSEWSFPLTRLSRLQLAPFLPPSSLQRRK